MSHILLAESSAALIGAAGSSSTTLEGVTTAGQQPTTAALAQGALGGYGTLVAGYLFDVASGSIPAAFGSPSTLTVTGAPTYGIAGPLGGADKAVSLGAYAATMIDGGDVFDLSATDDLVIAWAGRFTVAPSGGEFSQIIGKVTASFGDGWSIAAGDGSTGLVFSMGPGSSQGTSTGSSSDFRLGEWHVGIAALSRTTGKARIALRYLSDGDLRMSPLATVTATVANAASFTVGNSLWVPGQNGFQIAALLVGHGTGAATGVPENMTAAIRALASRFSIDAHGTVVTNIISGTAAVTLGALSSSAAGKVQIKGTAARTLANVTSSSAGKVQIKATLAATLAALSSTAAGKVAIRGAAAPTLGPLQLASTGRLPIVGAGAPTLADITGQVGTGIVYTALTTSGQLQDLTATATGTAYTPVVLSSLQTVTKTAGGVAWNAGAFSSSSLNGSGYVEAVAVSGQTRAFGLSADDPDTLDTSIDYAFRFTSSSYTVRENNAIRYTAPYASGDRFRIRYTGSQIDYLHNGAVVWTSSIPAAGPLFVDVALNTAGSSLQIELVDGTQIPLVWATLVNAAAASPSTLEGVVAAATAAVQVQGQVAAQLADMQCVAASSLTTFGAAAIALADLVAVAAGVTPIRGAAAVQLAGLATTIAGSMTAHANLAATLDGVQLATAGTNPGHGALTAQLDDVTGAATAVGLVIGRLFRTLADLTSSGAGDAGGNARVVATLGALTSTSSVVSSIRGAGAVTLAPLTSRITAERRAGIAELAATLAPITAAIAGITRDETDSLQAAIVELRPNSVQTHLRRAGEVTADVIPRGVTVRRLRSRPA